MDSRDWAAYRGRDSSKVEFEWEDDDGCCETITLPTKFEVCPLCQGKGTHVNPSIDAHGLTAEDFAEDPDFAEEYFSGAYDQTCNECNGRNVVAVADQDQCSAEDWQRYQAHLQNEADYRSEVAHQMKYGY